MEELVAEFEHLKIIRCIGMIDLHGYLAHEAWRFSIIKLMMPHYNGMRKVVVVTGQGAIMREMFPSGYPTCTNTRI